MSHLAPHDRTSLARRLSLGRLALKYYYRPRSWVGQLVRQGVWASLQEWWNESAMKAAACRVPPSPPRAAGGATEVCFLTGHRYWHQTIFCARSLELNSSRPLRFVFFDDGTLRPAEAARLQRVFPGATLWSEADLAARLARRLPPERYPLIWYYRRNKPLFRKLTDIFGTSDDWRLLLDSDMLFFRPPVEVHAWLEQPAAPCYMVDVVTAYGYSRPLMESLTGHPLAERINIGLFGFCGQLIDWDRVEAWIGELTRREGLLYNFAQGISAMLLAGRSCVVLDATRYRLLPEDAETEHPTAVMHHYVAQSKRGYFRYGWQQIAALQPVPVPGAKLARQLRLGRIAYLFWHAPRAEIALSRRAGGPWQQWLDARGRRQMQKAARRLPPARAADSGAPEIVFLTGRRFWYQTAFCFHSLQRQAGRSLRPVFIDDGTFDSELRAECERLFPGASVRSQEEIESQLDRFLPHEEFPTLRSQRQTYIHLRKLTDAHAGRSGWRLVLDSDMLFFRPPVELLSWLEAPDRPVHMADVQDCYGYPAATLEQIAGGPIPPHVNVGICGLRSDAIDWNQLEAWCAELLRRHGTSYYLEQALVALYLTRHPAHCLPARDFVLMPGEPECRNPTAVMHHYVDLSKRGYFRHAWRRVIADGAKSGSRSH